MGVQVINKYIIILFVFLFTCGCVSSKEICSKEFESRIENEAGFINPSRFIKFYKGLLFAVQAKNFTDLALIIKFEIKLNTNENNRPVTMYYSSSQEISDNANKLFTKKVIDVLLSHDICTSIINWQGVGIGNGIIWISVYGEDDEMFYLITINN